VKNETFTCERARQIDLVEYLATLGHHPTKMYNNDYWYISPLRNEKTASFKINKKMNVWYDHGTGKGGNLIDFGKVYYGCTVGQLLKKLASEPLPTFSSQQQPAGEKEETEDPHQRIMITAEREITDPALREYLGQRKIPLVIANRYCSEVDFELYGKKHTAIGFKNDRGGYELRNSYFKASTSPKDITTIRNGAEKISVFEGFFDFLSFQTTLLSDRDLVRRLPKLHGDFLILNSLSFLEKSRELMEKHDRIALYLDRDERGIQKTERALLWSEKYVDESIMYREFKDLNESLISEREQEIKQSRRLKPKL